MTSVVHAFDFGASLDSSSNLNNMLANTSVSMQTSLSNNTSSVPPDTELSTFETVTESKGILKHLRQGVYGFSWLINSAFGGLPAPAGTAVTILTVGLDIITTFLLAWLIISFFRGVIME